MLRKTLLAGVSLFACLSSSHASFYVGAGLGPDTVDFKQTAHVVSFNPAFTTQGFNVQDKTHLSGTGVFGTVFAGYALVQQQFFFAG